MFGGLDDVDWAGMDHAYGPALEVPDLLRGLVSDDPAAREVALDGMYGAVHHQGDVYECTVAAVPFLLEAAGSRSLPGRGAVLELLASIGGAERDDTAETEEEGEGGDGAAPGTYFGAARRAVAAAFPLFQDLLADADPEVRRAAPPALLACRADAPTVIATLQDRLAAETDAAARIAIVTAIGKLGRRAAGGQTGVDSAAVAAWLAELAARPGDPAFRLAVTAELARSAPGALTSEMLPGAIELLRATYAAATPPARPAGFSTNTLAGAVRETFEREAAGRCCPDATELVRDLSDALGEHVEDRVRLLTELLGAPGWEARHDAIRPAKVLMEIWRGQYQELVVLIGEQLADPEPGLPEVAAAALEYLDALAAPAADALARALEDAPREAPHTRHGGLPAWITTWPRDLSSVGPTLRALAALGDRRALPAVRWALEHPDMPGDIGLLAGRFGPDAADLVPLIRRRLRDLPGVDGHDRRRYGLLVALGRIGEAAAAAVPELLALPPEPVVLTTLGRIGPDAAAARAELRRLLSHGKPAIEIAAASALWRVDPDPGPILPVLASHLDGDGPDVIAAAGAVAEVGRAAGTMAPRLRELVSGGGGSAWLRLRAALALWRVTGDADTALAVLPAVWSENPFTREHIARGIAEMGPPARAVAPLLREELGRRRRHTAREHGWSSDQVRADLELLRACDAALAALDG